MSLIRDEAVCLRHQPWSETSQTVTLFGHAHGLFRGIAKGTRRERAPFSGGFETLTLGEYQAIKKPVPRMTLLTSWDLIDPAPGFRATLWRFHTGLLACDLVRHVILDDDPHPRSYLALAALVRSGGNTAKSHAVVAADLAAFIAELLHESGHLPEALLSSDQQIDPDQIHEFSPDTGMVSSPSHSGTVHWRLRGSTLKWMRDHINLGVTRNPDSYQTQPDPGGSDPMPPLRASYLLASLCERCAGRAIPTLSGWMRTSGLSPGTKGST